MSYDILNLICPSCEQFVEVYTYSGDCTKAIYSPETAPLCIISEVNAASHRGELQCFNCGMHLALVVSFITVTRALSTQQRYDPNWKDNKKLLTFS